jgi:hypothetical protein
MADVNHSPLLPDILRRGGSRIDARAERAGRSADSALVHGLTLVVRDQERKIHELQRQAASELLTCPAVANRLGVSANSVSRWADAGKLAYIVLPDGSRRFTLEGITALLAACERHQATS